MSAFFGVSNHQPHDCSPNHLFRRRSKKASKLSVTSIVRGVHRWPVNSPHKGPVKRKCFHLMTSSWPLEAFIHQWTLLLLVQCMIWRQAQTSTLISLNQKRKICLFVRFNKNWHLFSISKYQSANEWSSPWRKVGLSEILLGTLEYHWNCTLNKMWHTTTIFQWINADGIRQKRKGLYCDIMPVSWNLLWDWCNGWGIALVILVGIILMIDRASWKIIIHALLLTVHLDIYCMLSVRAVRSLARVTTKERLCLRACLNILKWSSKWAIDREPIFIDTATE